MVEVQRVARVARLKLTEKEEKLFSSDLEGILKAFAVLDEADTKSVAPSFRPLEGKNVLREDKPEPCLGQGALSLTELKEGKSYKGPKVI